MPAAPPGCAEGIGPRQASVFVVGMGVTGSRCTLRPCGQAERSCAEHAREEESARLGLAPRWPRRPQHPLRPAPRSAPLRVCPARWPCDPSSGSPGWRGDPDGLGPLRAGALRSLPGHRSCSSDNRTTTSARPTPAGLPRASAHPPSHASGQPPEVGTMWVLLYT